MQEEAVESRIVQLPLRITSIYNHVGPCCPQHLCLWMTFSVIPQWIHLIMIYLDSTCAMHHLENMGLKRQMLAKTCYNLMSIVRSWYEPRRQVNSQFHCGDVPNAQNFWSQKKMEGAEMRWGRLAQDPECCDTQALNLWLAVLIHHPNLTAILHKIRRKRYWRKTIHTSSAECSDGVPSERLLTAVACSAGLSSDWYFLPLRWKYEEASVNSIKEIKVLDTQGDKNNIQYHNIDQ